MHEEVLNYMLANTCHNETMDDGEKTKFTFDLHCVEVQVVARFIGDWETKDHQYEIVSWSKKLI